MSAAARSLFFAGCRRTHGNFFTLNMIVVGRSDTSRQVNTYFNFLFKNVGQYPALMIELGEHPFFNFTVDNTN